MNINELEELIATKNIAKLKTALDRISASVKVPENLKQYEPALHKVNNKTDRRDKTIYKEAENMTGEKVIDHYIPVARLSLPLQKKIVRTAVRFLGSPEIKANIANEQQQAFFDILDKVFKSNKLHYKFKEISRTVMSEKHCAELWYTEIAPENFWNEFNFTSPYKLRTRILSETKGDRLYPIFDDFEDMIAFGRGYFSEKVNYLTGTKQTVECLDIYTDVRIYEFKKETGKNAVLGWVVNVDASIVDAIAPENNYTGDGFDGRPNPFGKIPVVYYSQPQVEWSEIQSLIERLETKISNHADTNDYYDSPIVVAKGQVEGFSNKGEQGKLLQAENGADVSYLTWDNAPASMKMEIDNLWNYIHNFTSTPDLSFENLKGLGYFSNIALKTMFMDAHMKASEKEEIFGEGVQRRINLVSAMLAALDQSHSQAANLLDAYPEFEFYLPENEEGELTSIKTSLDAGIISLQTAVGLNPLVEDPQLELQLIEEEKLSNTPPALATGVPPIVPALPAIPPVLPAV